MTGLPGSRFVDPALNNGARKEVYPMNTNVKFAQESWAMAVDEMKPLFEAHWREVATDLTIPLEPDYARYQGLDDANCLRVYTVRARQTVRWTFPGHGFVEQEEYAGTHEESPIVGYVIFFVAPHAHYKSSLQAYGDVIFLDPEFRRGTIARELIRFAEESLGAMGVQVVRYHVKVAHPALGVVLQRMHYAHTEDGYEKRIR